MQNKKLHSLLIRHNLCWFLCYIYIDIMQNVKLHSLLIGNEFVTIHEYENIVDSDYISRINFSNYQVLEIIFST